MKCCMRDVIGRVGLTSIVLVALGCHDHDDHKGHEHAEHPPVSATAATAKPTNRVPLSASTRENLGITFVRAERRIVSRTLRVPGRIALAPESTRVVRTPMSGPVSMRVPLLSRVEADTVVAVLRAPEIRTAQDALHRARHDADEASDLARVAEARRQEAERAISSIQKRIRSLDAMSVRRADIEAELEAARRRGDVAAAELAAARSRIERERHHFSVQLRAFSERVGLPVGGLTAPVPDAMTHGGEIPEAWEVVGDVSLVAGMKGVVVRLHVTGEGWAAEGDPLIEVVDDQRWRFEGQILEADLPRLPDAAKTSPVGATVIPAWPADASLPAPVKMTLQLGLVGDPDHRRFPVYATTEAARPPWALPGVGAFAEIVLAGTGEPEIAVPKAAVVRDGLTSKVFVRDPKDTEQVIETEVDLGPDDGRWVAVLAGVNAGEEVVLAGAYELKVASASQPQVKGHFHADGSFHEGEDDDGEGASAGER